MLRRTSLRLSAARSDDDGQTFGPGIAMYNLSECGGLHGHLKVGPDGTAYVPNRGCGANQAVVVSRDNGTTWTVKPIPQSSACATDPSVGIAMDNTLYFGYQNDDGHPHIAVSKDYGDHWSDVDVSQNTIQNCVFPEVVAGDGNRAAFGFLGTSSGGNYQDTANFEGVWFFYIATTLDGGKTYTLVDGTNGDPVQVGSICTGGTTCGADRNLLDFNDITIDKQGRVLAAYADGCVAPGCTAATATSSTPPYSASRSALSSIVRQSGGPRLLQQFDPTEPAVPAAPQLTAAVVTSSPDGDLPLKVSFDASGSADADPGDTIASHTFNFGDRSQPVMQTTPNVDHTYTTRGVFRATVSVIDSRGAPSGNFAGLEIEIDAELQNISTRELVLTGDNVLIAGFIITGPDPKKVIIGAIGPSIKGADGQPMPGTLQDPTLELHDVNSVLAFNDNWKDSQQADIQATGLAPIDDREAAIVTTLAPGAYTAIVRGKNDTTGIALVELFDIDIKQISKLANISSRGFVQAGDNVMIRGFIVGPPSAGKTKALVRAISPSLKSQLPQCSRRSDA